jgi:ABC-2 type transport system ATP-binding protein
MHKLTEGSGLKKMTYECRLDNVNNVKLKLQLSVRNAKDEMVAYDPDEKIIMINRLDIAKDDLSAKDSSSGLLQRNGAWDFA